MTSNNDGEITLDYIRRLVWRHRVLVGIMGLLGAVIAGAYAFTTKPVFRADIVVTAAHGTGMEHTSSLLGGQLGTLANLAGLDVSQGNTQNQEAAAVLESHQLAAEFIRRNNLVPVLVAESSGRPTMWLAVKRLKERVLEIRKDQRRGTTTVSVEWTDPQLAAGWANEYVAVTNELIRTRALDDATRNIAYLNEQLAKTSDVELRKVMYTLVENETKTLMLANARKQYAFEVVDPAVAPELWVRPRRLMLTSIGFLLGLGAAGAFVLVRERMGRASSSS